MSKDFFSIASLAKDNSFTDFATRTKGEPSLLTKLQGPFRILYTPLFQSFLEGYTSDSLRFFLFYISSPRFLYGTNPSSIVHFLQYMNSEETLRFTKDFFEKKLDKQKEVEVVYKQMADHHLSYNDLISKKKIELSDICPYLEEVICWDSGYLKSYVDQIKTFCREDVLFQSMSSMSTEVTQTVCFGDRRLPMGREICYEFYNLEKTEILRPHQLEVGGEYIMIISNQHGLIRYDTNDIFYVKGMFFGVPDLIFKKRYGINFDFAGEKLNADQVQTILERIRLKEAYKNLTASLVPSGKEHNYNLYIIGTKVKDLTELSNIFDLELQQVNFLYKTRRETQLLSRPKAIEISIEEFVKLINEEKVNSWESQFKFLPLYPYRR